MFPLNNPPVLSVIHPMKLFFASLLGIVLSPAFSISAEAPINISTRTGREYVGVQVKGIEPDGIRIQHSEGAAKLLFTELPENLQKEYGYDVTKASAYQAKMEADAQARAAIEARNALAVQDASEAAAFTELRRTILTSLQSGKYHYADLDTLISKWIDTYNATGRGDWVKLLQEDRELLKQRELQRPAMEAAKRTSDLEAQNAKLQDQINQLKTTVQAQSNIPTRTTTYFSDPFPYQYYYNPQPIIIRQPVVVPVPQYSQQPVARPLVVPTAPAATESHLRRMPTRPGPLRLR